MLVSSISQSSVAIRDLGLVEYLTCLQAMKDFTKRRDHNTLDEIWFLEHPPVFTQGKSGRVEHIIGARGIPVLESDRGGQITYHGPGQLIAYLLFDLNRSQTPIRCFVHAVEKALIECLAKFGVIAERLNGSPGVYVAGRKIASIGFRISKGLTYHGLSLNVDMNLEPFSYINPCGIAGLLMTQISEFDYGRTNPRLINDTKSVLAAALQRCLHNGSVD